MCPNWVKCSNWVKCFKTGETTQTCKFDGSFQKWLETFSLTKRHISLVQCCSLRESVKSVDDPFSGEAAELLVKWFEALIRRVEGCWKVINSLISSTSSVMKFLLSNKWTQSWSPKNINNWPDYLSHSINQIKLFLKNIKNQPESLL